MKYLRERGLKYGTLLGSARFRFQAPKSASCKHVYAILVSIHGVCANLSVSVPFGGLSVRDVDADFDGCLTRSLALLMSKLFSIATSRLVRFLLVKCFGSRSSFDAASSPFHF